MTSNKTKNWYYFSDHLVGNFHKTLLKKPSLPLRIFQANVNKFAVSYRFVPIYYKNLECKTSFFCAMNALGLRYLIAVSTQQKNFQIFLLVNE